MASVEIEAIIRDKERVWIDQFGNVILEMDNISIIVYYSHEEKEELSPDDSFAWIARLPKLQEQLEKEYFDEKMKEKYPNGVIPCMEKY